MFPDICIRLIANERPWCCHPPPLCYGMQPEKIRHNATTVCGTGVWGLGKGSVYPHGSPEVGRGLGRRTSVTPRWHKPIFGRPRMYGVAAHVPAMRTNG